jgi:hypothetical protein
MSIDYIYIASVKGLTKAWANWYRIWQNDEGDRIVDIFSGAGVGVFWSGGDGYGYLKHFYHDVVNEIYDIGGLFPAEGVVIFPTWCSGRVIVRVGPGVSVVSRTGW